MDNIQKVEKVNELRYQVLEIMRRIDKKVSDQKLKQIREKLSKVQNAQ